MRSGFVSLIGRPNSGKSTLINRFAGRNVTKTANMAGVTKNLSWIRVNKNIELLDSPGILWPKFEDDVVALNLASLTSIKEEILDSEEIARYIIIHKCVIVSVFFICCTIWIKKESNTKTIQCLKKCIVIEFCSYTIVNGIKFYYTTIFISFSRLTF